MTFTFPDFSPEVLLKFMRSVTGHFVMFFESGMQIIMCISGNISVIITMSCYRCKSHR